MVLNKDARFGIFKDANGFYFRKLRVGDVFTYRNIVDTAETDAEAKEKVVKLSE